MIEVRKTVEFLDWFAGLRDFGAQARIRTRIDRLELGLLGDAKFFDGIDKHRQDKDIKRAIDMAKEI